MSEHQRKATSSTKHHEILLVDTPMNTTLNRGDGLNMDLAESILKNESQFSLPKVSHKFKQQNSGLSAWGSSSVSFKKTP